MVGSSWNLRHDWLICKSKTCVGLKECQSEGGQFVGFIGDEVDGAIASLHDLSGNGQANAASLRLGGEEGYKDVACYVIGNHRSVVGDVDDDGFLRVGVCAQCDLPFLSDGLGSVFQ